MDKKLIKENESVLLLKQITKSIEYKYELLSRLFFRIHEESKENKEIKRLAASGLRIINDREEE
jgi:hypothetical protein